MKRIEISSIEQLENLLEHKNKLSGYSFSNIDFTSVKDIEDNYTFKECLFLGCTLPDKMLCSLYGTNLVFSSVDTPFDIFRQELYTTKELYGNYNSPKYNFSNCYDQKVYRNYLKHGKELNADIDIKESLARTLHDHSISDALHDFIAKYPEKNLVGIMGGHGLPRTDSGYAQVARISKSLTEKGYLMVSGGGPGAMEATHLGAWMAGRSIKELNDAIKILKKAPTFKDEGWLDSVFEVVEKYPQSNYCSLGIPTWLYGHEPATPFATHIAKYFDNSIREDGILTIAKGGIIYTPGSAGTMQEIFQDATQNHYKTFGYASPMVFLGVDYWTKQMPVYPLIEDLVEKGRYQNLILSLSDNEEEIVKSILNFNSQSL